MDEKTLAWKLQSKSIQALHIVNAWSTSLSMTLVKCLHRRNEIIPELPRFTGLVADIDVRWPLLKRTRSCNRVHAFVSPIFDLVHDSLNCFFFEVIGVQAKAHTRASRLEFLAASVKLLTVAIDLLIGNRSPVTTFDLGFHPFFFENQFRVWLSFFHLSLPP